MHISNELWNTSINRLYYSCYYAVSALLIYKDINASTHSGVRLMFGLHFIKPGIISSETGKFFSDIFDLRQTGDYDDFIDFEKEDVLALVSPAERLFEEVSKIVFPSQNASV